MRSVNENLRHTAELLAHPDPIMFFCECSAADCHAPLWLSRAAFDAVVTDESGWQLAHRHLPSGRWSSGLPDACREAGSATGQAGAAPNST